MSETVAKFFDWLGDKIVCVAESVDWFVRQHPLLTIAIFIVLFMGGCEISVQLHIVSSSTKLMPY